MSRGRHGVAARAGDGWSQVVPRLWEESASRRRPIARVRTVFPSLHLLFLTTLSTRTNSSSLQGALSLSADSSNARAKRPFCRCRSGVAHIRGAFADYCAALSRHQRLSMPSDRRDAPTTKKKCCNEGNTGGGGGSRDNDSICSGRKSGGTTAAHGHGNA